MPDWLQEKMAGLPRWAWGLMLVGGIGVGLYLRNRPEEELSEDELDGEVSFNEVYGEETGGGVAPASLVGPSSGQVTPVEAPYLPEGITDIFADLTGTLSDLGDYITQQQETEAEGGGPPAASPPREEERVPSPDPAPSPDPECRHKAEIRRNRRKSETLGNQINALEREIQGLASNMQRFPNAKKRQRWQKEINHKRQGVQNRRQKRQELAQRNQTLRNRPGCGSA